MKILKFLMFNWLTKTYLHTNPWFLRWNKRTKTIVIEMWYSLSIFLPIMIILMISIMFFDSHTQKSFERINLLTLIPFNLFFVVIINKDFFGGQSVVHRLFGYQVVDKKTMLPASKLKCMLRNATAPLWMIEVIFALAYPQRRLGDFIAGTKLVEVDASDPELILNEMKNVTFDRQTRMTLLFSILWVLAFSIVFNPGLRWW